jgi:hypothetical protein
MTAAAPFEAAAPVGSLAERLERGEIVYFPTCPFALPHGEDRCFLLNQQSGIFRKYVSYDPHTGTASGLRRTETAAAERLCSLLAAFSRHASAWLAQVLPRYANGWRLERVRYLPKEEATRRLRWEARNDLLHVDSSPRRPTHGDRILRLGVNIHPQDARVWVTSEPFAKLLERYGEAVGLPRSQGFGWTWRLPHEMVDLFRPHRPRLSPYDAFMLRFHDFLKRNDDFQERCPKRYWSFAPESAWLAFTDSISHAVLRGQYALEHTYFVSPQMLALPAEAPVALLERACGISLRGQAA